MRFVYVTALVLLSVTPAPAQESIDFVSRDDGFEVNFPAQPKVTDTTYTSEYGAMLPAHVYSVAARPGTLLDHRRRLSRHREDCSPRKSKQCPPFADERCTGGEFGAAVGFGYWKTDIRGALVWASWQFMQRDAKVTHYMWNFIDLVEGHQLQLTNNRDKSRTFVAIYMHDNRLYISEGTVPDGDPEPGLFQQSLGFVDKDGNGIRYRDYYDNDYPPPPRTGRGAGPAPAAPGAAPQGGAR